MAKQPTKTEFYKGDDGGLMADVESEAQGLGVAAQLAAVDARYDADLDAVFIKPKNAARAEALIKGLPNVDVVDGYDEYYA